MRLAAAAVDASSMGTTGKGCHTVGCGRGGGVRATREWWACRGRDASEAEDGGVHGRVGGGGASAARTGKGPAKPAAVAAPSAGNGGGLSGTQSGPPIPFPTLGAAKAASGAVVALGQVQSNNRGAWRRGSVPARGRRAAAGWMFIAKRCGDWSGPRGEVPAHAHSTDCNGREWAGHTGKGRGRKREHKMETNTMTGTEWDHAHTDTKARTGAYVNKTQAHKRTHTHAKVHGQPMTLPRVGPAHDTAEAAARRAGTLNSAGNHTHRHTLLLVTTSAHPQTGPTTHHQRRSDAPMSAHTQPNVKARGCNGTHREGRHDPQRSHRP